MSLDQAREHEWQAAIDECSGPPYLHDPAAIIAKAALRTSFLFTNAVPAGAISFIVGPPGGAKSWLAYDMAIAVARGTPWLGIPCERQGRVLVFSYDNPPAETGRRFLRLGLRPSDPMRFHVPDGPLFLRIGAKSDGCSFGHADILRGVVERLEPTLVVVDSFRQAHVQDENSSNEMGVVMAHIKSLVGAGAAVVIVHHSTTDAEGAIKARGSGEITASADLIVTVQERQARWKKVRSWPEDASPGTVDFVVRDDGDRTLVQTGAEALMHGVDEDLLERVQAHLYEYPESKVRDVVSAVGGTTAKVAAAVKVAKALSAAAETEAS